MITSKSGLKQKDETVIRYGRTNQKFVSRCDNDEEQAFELLLSKAISEDLYSCLGERLFYRNSEQVSQSLRISYEDERNTPVLKSKENELQNVRPKFRLRIPQYNLFKKTKVRNSIAGQDAYLFNVVGSDRIEKLVIIDWEIGYRGNGLKAIFLKLNSEHFVIERTVQRQNPEILLSFYIENAVIVMDN